MEMPLHLEYDKMGCFLLRQGIGKCVLCIATCFGKKAQLTITGVGREKVPTQRMEKLLAHAVDYLRSCGSTRIALLCGDDTVSAAEGLGFRRRSKYLEFSGQVYGRTHSHVRQLHASDWKRVRYLDKHVNGIDRFFFLERWYEENPALCRVLLSNGTIVGFLFARPRGKQLWVGPWVILRNSDSPSDLLEDVVAHSGLETIALVVPEENHDALLLLRALGLRQNSEMWWRMMMGAGSAKNATRGVFAIGSLTCD
jgi:hypothetical protein